ncbi:MAG: (E)-4-hydroxy-3-methylbut-2-enyl-diphosphate synthase [Bacteroidetes bacterium]|nr:(E)-4-hydroxy-3-methylbut-2-enyl-diphosphate synthase [Bacteroidota bacterium]
MADPFVYCNSLTSYSRIRTRVVQISDIPLGGDNPIRIQSMTSTNTLDTYSTVDQVIRMVNAGCEYARITTQNLVEAENLKHIREELQKRGYRIPLIADVHFNPKIAEIAAGLVEKVRVNPGNYADKKTGKAEFSESEYQEGLERIRERLIPLIRICKSHGTALRIGSNHGSLSERIMSRYGDTPYGMTESVLEFVRICRDEGFHSLVLSLKSSNTRVMVQSNRLLVHRMMEEGMDYPVHLGVTEAGEGEDGRIKSAVGIGALLEDGIGDTIRVSLTEDPECEIPIAKILSDRYTRRQPHLPIPDTATSPHNPFEYHKRETIAAKNIGSTHAPIVITNEDTENLELIPAAEFDPIKSTGLIYPFVITRIQDIDLDLLQKLEQKPGSVMVFETTNTHGMAEQRRMFFELLKHSCKVPVIIKRTYRGLDKDRLIVYSSTDLGALLVDGFGDGIWIDADPEVETPFLSSLSLGILQASRTMFSKAEFIACPSCGRTQFNIQETLKLIRERTGHLKKLTIAVMGCIVNGPGEMADADYGYVGSGHGKVTLYKGREALQKNIDEKDAVEALVEIIKLNGDWSDQHEGSQ